VVPSGKPTVVPTGKPTWTPVKPRPGLPRTGP
jgi:hypothetical protein